MTDYLLALATLYGLFGLAVSVPVVRGLRANGTALGWCLFGGLVSLVVWGPVFASLVVRGSIRRLPRPSPRSGTLTEEEWLARLRATAEHPGDPERN